jgi:hypothetical protein
MAFAKRHLSLESRSSAEGVGKDEFLGRRY